LDASNNALTELDLRNCSKNLVALNCSGNPLANFNLSLGYSPKLNSFDCLGIKVDKSTTISTFSATASATPTSLVNSSNNAIMTTAIPLGTTLLASLAFNLAFCYKYR